MSTSTNVTTLATLDLDTVREIVPGERPRGGCAVAVTTTSILAALPDAALDLPPQARRRRVAALMAELESAGLVEIVHRDDRTVAPILRWPAKARERSGWAS